MTRKNVFSWKFIVKIFVYIRISCFLKINIYGNRVSAVICVMCHKISSKQDATSRRFRETHRFFHGHMDTTDTKIPFLFILCWKIHVFYNVYIFSVNFRENAFFSVRSVQSLINKGFYHTVPDTSDLHIDASTAKSLFLYIYISKICTFKISVFFFLKKSV